MSKKTWIVPNPKKDSMNQTPEGGENTPVDWGQIQDKPSEFPPEQHTHEISEITSLQDTLDNKVEKVQGKQLSTEDYTSEEKEKLQKIDLESITTTLEENNSALKEHTQKVASKQNKGHLQVGDDLHIEEGVLSLFDNESFLIEYRAEFEKLLPSDLGNVGVSVGKADTYFLRDLVALHVGEAHDFMDNIAILQHYKKNEKAVLTIYASQYIFQNMYIDGKWQGWNFPATKLGETLKLDRRTGFMDINIPYVFLEEDLSKNQKIEEAPIGWSYGSVDYDIDLPGTEGGSNYDSFFLIFTAYQSQLIISTDGYNNFWINTFMPYSQEWTGWKQIGNGEELLELVAHMSNKNNPHNVTKEQIGLDKVKNEEQATKEELDFAVNEKIPSIINSMVNHVHARMIGNEQRSGHLQLTDKITNNFKANNGFAITPNAVYTVDQDLQNHKNDKNNPHNVTKEQIGLGNVENVQQASKEELNKHKNEVVEIIKNTESRLEEKIEGIENIGGSRIPAIDKEEPKEAYPTGVTTHYVSKNGDYPQNFGTALNIKASDLTMLQLFSENNFSQDRRELYFRQLHDNEPNAKFRRVLTEDDYQELMQELTVLRNAIIQLGGQL